MIESMTLETMDDGSRSLYISFVSTVSGYARIERQIDGIGWVPVYKNEQFTMVNGVNIVNIYYTPNKGELTYRVSFRTSTTNSWTPSEIEQTVVYNYDDFVLRRTDGVNLAYVLNIVDGEPEEVYAAEYASFVPRSGRTKIVFQGPRRLDSLKFAGFWEASLEDKNTLLSFLNYAGQYVLSTADGGMYLVVLDNNQSWVGMTVSNGLWTSKEVLFDVVKEGLG